MFPLLVKEQLEFWPEKDVRQRVWVRFLHLCNTYSFKHSSNVVILIYIYNPNRLV